MKLLKLFALFTMLFTANIYAVTISGNVNCDINNNGIIESGELCPSEAIYVKLYNVEKGRLISQQTLYPSGAFEFQINATGAFRLFVDSNGNTKDSTPTVPPNLIFDDPISGEEDFSIVDVNEVSTGHDFVLIPDPSCDCTAGDNNLTRAEITIDGVMNDWVTVLTDPDNGVCDSATQTDYDVNLSNTGLIQSTGRNLTHFVWTGQDDENGFVYGYTERAGSTTNTETFLFYKDGDADGLMETGDIALTAGWQGNTGTVKMEICDYEPADPLNGDPMVWQESDVGDALLYPDGATVTEEWVGKADGYTLQGGLINCRTAPGLVGIGSADGLEMEWQVAWKTVGMEPFQPITYHVSTMNSSVNLNNPPGQVDDNLGSCPLAAPIVKLDINKTVDNPIPRIGENVTYTITVTNSGDGTSSVVANDLLPAGVTYVSFSGTDWTCNAVGQDVNCSYAGVLMNGGSTSVDIVASVNDNTSLWGQTLTNSVCTSSDENATLICDEEDIIVYTPVVTLDINKTASNTTPYVGASIFYRIAITNNGPDVANNIVVHDALPTGVAYTGYFGDDWTCTEAANILDCSFTVGLGAGATKEFFILVDVTGPAGTPYTNTASTHADENTTDVYDSALITPVTPPAPATLTVEKGVSNSTPLTGETIVYGIIISNVGELNATNLVFTDTLSAPAGVVYDNNITYDSSLGGTLTFTAPDNITWSGFDLDAGTSTTIQITVKVAATAPATVGNQACAHHDDNSTDVCSDANFTVRAPDVQLLMDKSVDNENPRVGENVIYTLVVTNIGTDTANTVIVTDTLPAGVIYDHPDYSASAGTFDGTTWDGFNLPPASSEELNITVSIDVGQEGILLTNIAEAEADGATPVQDDANLTVYTPIVELTIQKVADKVSPVEGTNLTYTVIVNNIGEDNATNVTVTDTLPDGVTYLPDAGGDGWTCDFTGPDTIDCLYANELEPGLPASFDINVTVNPGTAGTSITNTACTLSNEIDSEVCTDLEIIVNNDLDLAITKVVNNPTPVEGETISYTITVINNGPITATGIHIIENISEIESSGGLIDIISNPLQGTMIDSDTWEIDTLLPGATARLEVNATVANGANGAYYNIASLDENVLDQNDSDTNNNSAQAIITVTCPCDNISSDSSPAMNKTVGVLMIVMTVLIGLFFVRREEQYNRNKR